jgi:catechol 2,3-dioxygenase-like lactoylglutathione lyase family enzyme
MHLNHLDLAVRDVPAASSFFQNHFDLSLAWERPGLALMTDGHGFALVLSALLVNESDTYPRGFHVGFNVPTSNEVTERYERIKAAAVPIVREPGLLGGALTFQCMAPGGLVVEVGHRAA